MSKTLLQIFVCVEDCEEVVDGTIVFFVRKDVCMVVVNDSLKGGVLVNRTSS